MVDVEFTVTCKMRERWVPQFLSMLALMERLGSWGSSRTVAIYSDGDGDFRPRFRHGVAFDEITPTEGTAPDYLFDAG